jgi:hypothetical protein
MATIQEICNRLLSTDIGTGSPSKSRQQEQELHKAMAPILTGRHSPSTASLATLQAIGLKALKQDSRHEKKVTYLAVQSVKISNGMTLAVKGSFGHTGSVWSLIAYPFPTGEKSMSTNSIIAIKEPYCGIDGNGGKVVCVHHPTDILRISKYDPAVSQHFPHLAGPDYEDFEKAGNAAFVLGNPREAIDINTECIKRAGPMPTEDLVATDTLVNLVIKRAFTYLRLELYHKALPDALDIIKQRMFNPQAVKLASTITIKAGKYLSATSFTEGLLLIQPHNDVNRRIDAEARAKLRQSEGEIDLNEIEKSMKQVHDVADIANFFGDFQIRKSKLRGRGAFATSRIKQGELLLCEKPIAIQHDHVKSSFTHGLKGVMNDEDEWATERTLSFL